MASRGERNNNPGNLEASSWTRSQPGYIGSDGRFAIFDTMANGIAAQVKLITNSYINKGYDTVSKIINRYGNDPGTADDPSVSNYIKYVSGKLGITPDTKISASQAGALTQAMREFETGNTTPTSSIGDTLSGVGNAILHPMDTVTDWFTSGIVARIAYVVIGIILIGLAIAAFVFATDSGQKIAIKAATGGVAG